MCQFYFFHPQKNLNKIGAKKILQQEKLFLQRSKDRKCFELGKKKKKSLSEKINYSVQCGRGKICNTAHNVLIANFKFT